MQGENEMNIFKELIKREPTMLDRPLKDLVPLSYIGSAAVQAYRSIVPKLKDLPMAQEQKAKTLADGQDAGKMLLAIESKIGNLTRQVPREKSHGAGMGLGSKPSGFPPKHERLGFSNQTAMFKAEMIANHPEEVAEVIQEAEEAEDIPTKGAVIRKIDEKKTADKEAAIKEQMAKGKYKPEPKPYLSEYLEDCIERQVTTNSVLKEIFGHIDQIDKKRLMRFVELVKRTVEIIKTNTEVEKKWKLLK